MAAYDFDRRGAALWGRLIKQDATLEDAGNSFHEVAVTACRTADRVDRLERLAAEVEPIIDGRTGPMTHPVFAEVRQQSALLARLVAALRLPDAESGARPQHRAVRGVQQPSALGVSSLERARARKGA